MKITEIEKNNETCNLYYSTYKASFVNQTGLPKFSRDSFDKVLEANLYSPSRAKKANLEITDEIGGWYRVMNGYKPLFIVKNKNKRVILHLV
ncbi:MAG: hypothetical protein R3Y35_07445 [Clostridia bacterium]